jgi:hypothetical protein
MFVKLKIENPFTPYTFLTSNNIHTEYVTKSNNKSFGIQYFITNLNTEKFSVAIPKNIIKSFSFQHMKINSRVRPHTDSYITCSINFYINTENCKTIFYQKKENAQPFKPTSSPYITNGLNYYQRDLIPVDSFIASPYEVWLLDTTQIHSVEPLNDGPLYRDAIVLQTNLYSFNQLKTICKLYGSI